MDPRWKSFPMAAKSCPAIRRGARLCEFRGHRNSDQTHGPDNTYIERMLDVRARMNPVGKALWYIESHFGEAITLDEIAAIGGGLAIYLAHPVSAPTRHPAHYQTLA